jgi:hypothetical protein
MNDKLVKDVMTSLDSVYMISLDTVLDARKLHEVSTYTVLIEIAAY